MSYYEVDMKIPPSRTADQYVVRFPEGLRAAIKRSAAENGRTMNAEIVFHLRKALCLALGGEDAPQA